MKIKLKVWRQALKSSSGKFQDIAIDHVSTDMSFLEMLDFVNQDLQAKDQEPIAFDYDCREGICGACSLVINGLPHGPNEGTTTCQLHMRSFKEGDEIVVEPFRANAFPVVKDLMVDRSAFDRIIQSGGYVSVNCGGAPDANALPIGKRVADEAFDAATCIGCGACVAACKNASAMLFLSAKVSQLALLPQGKVEAKDRVKNMLAQMDTEGFGHCSNTYECEAVCPKEISVDHIARLNREYLSSCC